MEEKRVKTIVIVGAGYAGIRIALDLGTFLKHRPDAAKEWMLYIVDRSDSHVFTPSLYETATALKEDATAWNIKRAVTLEYAEIFSGLPLRFVQDEVTAIKTDSKEIHLHDNPPLTYDILILALGSTTNFFNIPGLAEHSYPLKTAQDSIRIRNAITSALETENTGDIARIYIGGGGPTGVELAAELTRFIRKKCAKRINACRRNEIVLCEAGPTILGGFPASVATQARRRLLSLGVILKENMAIKSVDKNTISVSEGGGTTEQPMPYDVLVWAGGIRMSQLMENIIAPKDKKGRCIVEPTLRVRLERAPEQLVYALGDTACFADAAGKAIPGTAFIAISQGKIVARNIIADMTGSSKKIPYLPPRVFPFAIPLGGKHAIFSFPPVRMGGLMGWLIRIGIDLKYLFGILPPHKALAFWINSVWVSIKND